MVSTTGGSRPSRPRACRSSWVKAVPLFNDGVSRSACPRRCEERRDDAAEGDVVAIRTSEKNSGCLRSAKGGGLPARSLAGAAVRIAHSVRATARDGSKLSVRQAARRGGRKNAAK